jgi:ADP-ribose pyrophosphatase YjhB (NUDIX family)
VNKYDSATPYIASYVLLRDGDKMAFVLRQNTSWMNNYYGLPSGKVEKGEPYTAGAQREALEEVGVSIKLSNLRHALTVHRHGTDGTEWVDVYFEVSSWQGEVANAEPHMHSRVDWLDINNLPDNVIPSVTAALQSIQAGTTYSEYGWTGTTPAEQ